MFITYMRGFVNVKTKTLVIKVPEAMAAKILKLAKKDGSNTSQIVRAILCRSLKLKRSLAVLTQGRPVKG